MLVAVVGDLHSGSKSGLTPPGWQWKESDDPARHKWYLWQNALWRAYSGICQQIGAVDVAVVNGDAVNGKAPWSDGIENLEQDPAAQARMAAEAIRELQAKKHFVLGGTKAHSGKGTDFDEMVCEHLDNAEWLGTERMVNLSGLRAHFKHHVGTSGIPHGRATAISREALWVELNALHRKHATAHVIGRSHAHYAVDVGNRYWRAFVFPCLSGETDYPRSHGLRDIDVGVTVFDIKGPEEWTWKQIWIEPPMAEERVVIA